MLSLSQGAWESGPAPRLSRLVGAVVVAIVLHAALIFRLDPSGGSVSASSPAVMAVRIVPSSSLDAAVPTSVAALSAPAVEPPPERELLPTPTPTPQTKPAIDAESSRRKADAQAQSVSSTAAAAAPAGGALAAASDYAIGAQLDPGPRPLGDIEPDYPDTVRLRSGTVTLRLLISDSGHVDEVGVVRAEPPGVFEQAAIDAFSSARFSPGMAGGHPVKSQIRIEVEFMPINRGARISGRSY